MGDLVKDSAQAFQQMIQDLSALTARKFLELSNLVSIVNTKVFDVEDKVTKLAATKSEVSLVGPDFGCRDHGPHSTGSRGEVSGMEEQHSCTVPDRISWSDFSESEDYIQFLCSWREYEP